MDLSLGGGRTDMDPVSRAAGTWTWGGKDMDLGG